MPQDYSEFARLLNQHFQAFEQSNAWLAKKVRVNSSTVHRWLNGTQRPGDKKTVEKIGRILKLSHEELDTLLIAANYPPLYSTQQFFTTPANDNAIPDPLMNCKDEIAAFEKIATGKDTQTRLILIHGNSGTGKTRLLKEYEQIAIQNSLEVLPIFLEEVISVEECLEQIVYHFGPHHFRRYQEFMKSDRPDQITKIQKWQTDLTRDFFVDLTHHDGTSRLALFFDKYEKADRSFKSWVSRTFLPGIRSQQKLIVVIAGQEKVFSKPVGRSQCMFHLDGFSVDYFHQYVKACQVELDAVFINEVHKMLHGHPKAFVDYVRSQL